MKDSREYSKKIQQLYRSLKRRYPKPEKVLYDEPLDAVFYATLSENMSVSAAQAAVKRFSDYFADLNDLRVSRPEEIVEVLGTDTTVARAIASALKTVLQAVFRKYNMVSLGALKKISKRPAKHILEKIEGISHFAVNYCLLTALQGHAIPLTGGMIEYLRNNQLVHPDADQQEIEGFLDRQISARNAYEFYYLLRRGSDSAGPGAGKKTTRRKKAAAKTGQKTKKRTREGKGKK